MNLEKGDLVKVRVYNGQVQIRRLVEVRGQTAIITTDEEQEAATKQKREPVCIGLSLVDVVEVID